jgi:hypothetical protein
MQQSGFPFSGRLFAICGFSLTFPGGVKLSLQQVSFSLQQIPFPFEKGKTRAVFLSRYRCSRCCMLYRTVAILLRYRV